MAALGASLLGTVLCLSTFLCLGATKIGVIPPTPEDVYFDLQFYSHTLLWSPGNPAAEGILYEVQYLRYGTKLWKDVPHCFLTHHLSCDLTEETLLLGMGYYGRVRSILGNQTSDWARTLRYRIQEVTLPAPSFLLHVDGSSLMVDVSLPEAQAGNLSLHYTDLFRHNRKYIVHLRRTADNLTIIEEKNTTMFHIRSLITGREYCVAMQFKITSRLNNGILSPETCVYLPEEELDKSALLVVATAILVFVTILIFVNIIICLYVRGAMNTPKALSLIKRSWSWMEKPPTQISNCTDCLRWEDEFIDHLMMEPRNSPLRSSGDSGFGSQILTMKNSQLQSTSLVLSIDDSGVELPESDSDCKKAPLKGDPTFKMQVPKIQGEDSGISLSTGSPCLKRSCSVQEVSYRENINDIRDDKNISDSRLGYLRQSEPKKNQNNSEREDPEITHTKDYLKQEKQVLHSNNGIPIDNNSPQGQKEFLQGSWTNMKEGFHSSLPFTAAFSPFSRVLCDFRVNIPSLGDVQLLDIIS
ncbi:interleukin-10 receptor subunit alpha isoform X2 [Xenopus laevis]|uniref:Interleukin-10 receptor subunit alpha isoform X2 n=1 Tax=Xenopus laevis TaxID=8355 RepID=A0A8J0TBZ5_XENLA|nr:interleukin-10 receptor subunit alpha isoform X2 [Xenopus laevis]